jgi:RNA polymerase sigma-70 factor (ECF subfamily)
MYRDDKIVLDLFAQGIIRRKVRLLVKRAGFTTQDRPDLEQELVMMLVQGLNRFDPDQGHPNVFVTTVIERAVARILRKRRAKKRDGCMVHSLHRPTDGQPTDPIDPQAGREGEVDLANDLADVLARLPEKLRDLAERLKHRSLSAVARDLGVPRTTLQRKVQHLRRFFENAGLRIYL